MVARAGRSGAERHDTAHAGLLAIASRRAAPEGRAYIDGAYADAADGATFEARSPIDGRKLADVAACGQADVDRAVAFEAGACRRWRRASAKAALLRLAR